MLVEQRPQLLREIRVGQQRYRFLVERPDQEIEGALQFRVTTGEFLGGHILVFRITASTLSMETGLPMTPT